MVLFATVAHKRFLRAREALGCHVGNPPNNVTFLKYPKDMLYSRLKSPQDEGTTVL